MREHLEEADLFWPTVPIAQALGQTLDRIEENGSRKRRVLVTGFVQLDQVEALEIGELTLIGGGRRSGKTLLALSITEHVARVQERPVLYITARDPVVSLTERLVATHAGVSIGRLDSGLIRNCEWGKIGSAVKKLSDTPIHFYEHSYPSIDQISIAAARLNLSDDLGLVVIDDLAAVRGWDNGRSGKRKVVEGVTLMARTLAVPIIILLRTTSKFERGTKRPISLESVQGARALRTVRHSLLLTRTDGGSASTSLLRIEIELPDSQSAPIHVVFDDVSFRLLSVSGSMPTSPHGSSSIDP